MSLLNKKCMFGWPYLKSGLISGVSDDEHSEFVGEQKEIANSRLIRGLAKCRYGIELGEVHLVFRIVPIEADGEAGAGAETWCESWLGKPGCPSQLITTLVDD